MMPCEHAPTLETVTPVLLESIESSMPVNAYIERVRRKVPFVCREYSPGISCNSTEGIMHFDVGPDESVHWNFPVPLTDGTGDMTLRNMVVTLDVAHKLLHFQFDADIRVQVYMPNDDVNMACASVQTEADPVIPRFAARFNSRVLPHSISTLDTPRPISRPLGDACCILH